MLLDIVRWQRPRAALPAACAALLLFAAPLWAQDPVPPQPAAAVVVDSIRVEGNQRQPRSVILSEAGLTVGDTLSGPAAYQMVRRAIRRLMATGQFEDVQVLAEQSAPGATDRITLLVRVEERPFVGDVEVRGLESVSASTVRDSAGLRAGAPLQPERVAQAEHLIRSMLSEKGIRVRDVDHRLVELAGRPGEYRLILDVTEGQRVAISEVRFEGNEVFSDDRLREVLSTKEEGFWWFRPGTYDETQVREDLRGTLPAFYGSQGYIDFSVVGDSLVVDPETGKARLEIRIAEGERYRLAEFEVRGNRQFPTSDLTRYFTRETGGLLSGFGVGGGGEQAMEGEVFDQLAFQLATDRVQQLYRNQGYLYAQVEPVVERVETPEGPAVHAAWQIVEGDPAYVSRVTIAGNTFTHENVIRERLMVLPGDVYTDESVIRSMEAIMGLGFFETPMSPPDIRPDPQTGDVDVTFNVAEKQTGSLNFGTAIGGYGGLSGFLGYDQPNLFGKAKSGHIRWEFGRYSNNFEASYSDPAILESRVSGSASLFNSRNRFVNFSEGNFRRLGGSLRFGVPVPGDRWTRAFLGYSLVRTTYSQNTATPSSLFSLPDAMQSTVSMGVTRTTLNHPVFPTSGTRQEVSAEFSGGPLGGDGDFQKYAAGGAWWVPVGQFGGEQPGSRPVRMALGLTVEGGSLFGDASAFPFERFWMGGVQFGKALRGYDENTITPGGYFPRGAPGIDLEDRFGDAFLRMSAEYAIRFNDNLSVSAFYDAGSLWRDPLQMNPSRLFRGAGVGVMLVTPFGPLGLDYAYGFDRNIPGWQLHFKLGQMF